MKTEKNDNDLNLHLDFLERIETDLESNPLN